MAEKRKYPIVGTDYFQKIMDENGYYIDKTDVIPWILSRSKQCVLFTRPRRFGKSTMMSMLQTFWEYRVDREGKKVDNRHYFEGLKVAEDAEAMKQFGAFPVITITLKDVIQHTYEEAIKALATKISTMMRLSSWVCEQKITEADRQKIDQYISEKLPASDLSSSIAFLSAVLHDATDRKVIILIDEYDVPLQSAYLHGYYDEMLTFLRTFMSSALKTNPYLERGILTGCLRVSKESSLSGLNNIECHTIMSEGKREFFGFEPWEVKEMLHYFDLDAAYPQVEYNYDGYVFAGRHAHNPWSALMCTQALIENNKYPYMSYWANTSGNAVVADMMRNNPEFQEVCFQLLAGEHIRETVSEYLTWKDLNNTRYVWSLLTFSGYLNAIESELIYLDDWDCELAIPNREVAQIFAREIVRWFMDEAPNLNVRKLSQGFWENDIQLIKAQLRLVQEKLNYFDSHEAFYHGMMLGLLSAANPHIDSNIESGNGRLDIAVRYKESAFVIELKSISISDLKKLKIDKDYADLDTVTDVENARILSKLSSLANEALQQIEQNRYVDGLMNRYPQIKSVKCYGMAFCRRWVEIMEWESIECT